MERLANGVGREERRERGRELARELRELVARQDVGAAGQKAGKGDGKKGEQPQAGAMRGFLERATGGGGGGGAGEKEGASGSSEGAAGAGETGRDPDSARREAERWGSEHDPSLLDGKGAAVEVKGARRAVEVEAMVGAGPSRSQTIWEASVRGFATRGYRRAWEDYSSVSDEVMERDAVPPGYRWFVKRYFQLIRPRR